MTNSVYADPACSFTEGDFPPLKYSSAVNISENNNIISLLSLIKF